MSESSLSVAFPELKAETGQYLGYGRTVGDFSADEDVLVEAIVQSAIRRVYYPHAIRGPNGEPIVGHEWSFLRPSSTLYLGVSGTDGSVVTATFDSATYADWTTYGLIAGTDTVDITAGTGPTLTEYEISVVEATELTLASSPGDGTGLTFFISRDVANYTLPDDFNRLIGLLHHATDEHLPAIDIVSEGTILDMRSRGDLTGAPYYAAVREKSSTGSTGQRREIIFYPRPDKAYVLTYSYEAYSGILDDTYPYPLGGMHLSELYIESCLSVAEQRIDGEAGLHTTLFERLLVDAVMRDRKRGAKNFGMVGNTAEREHRGRFRHGMCSGTYSITYGGDVI